MKFEWDEEKNKANIRKHGLDFADAWEIFEAPMLTAPDAREDYGEERWISIGLLRNFVVVITYTEPIPKEREMLFALSPCERL